MKVLVLPLLLTLLPIAVLFLILNFWFKRNQVSILIKISLGIIFFALGIIASFFAMQLSMGGMVDKNIKCVTGAIVFMPLGFLIYSIAIPVILLFYKKNI